MRVSGALARSQGQGPKHICLIIPQRHSGQEPSSPRRAATGQLSGRRPGLGAQSARGRRGGAPCCRHRGTELGRGESRLPRAPGCLPAPGDRGQQAQVL